MRNGKKVPPWVEPRQSWIGAHRCYKLESNLLNKVEVKKERWNKQGPPWVAPRRAKAGTTLAKEADDKFVQKVGPKSYAKAVQNWDWLKSKKAKTTRLRGRRMLIVDPKKAASRSTQL